MDTVEGWLEKADSLGHSTFRKALGVQTWKKRYFISPLIANQALLGFLNSRFFFVPVQILRLAVPASSVLPAPMAWQQ